MTPRALTVLAIAPLVGVPVKAAPGEPQGPAPAELHVLIVGVNQSQDPGVEPLRFADDDAARYAEVLSPGATSITLLTLLDAESQERFAGLAAQARVPTLAALQSATERVFKAIRAAHAAGREADLLLIYTGHGGVSEHGEGYVWLQDHRLLRSELFARVISPSPARYNHVVIDACSAYYLLNRGAEAVRQVRELLSSSTLLDHPNTGALLATSRDRATHEWSQIGGGVFSHQILSALAGAADVDNDGALRYEEVGAFVEAANEGVEDRRARIDLYLRPPAAQLDRPLWRLSEGGGPHLVLAQDLVGHVAIADARGVPVAEVNKNSEQALRIGLSGAAPYTVQLDGASLQSAGAVRGELAVPDLVETHPELRPRSAVALALERGLYAVPFGQSYVRGYSVRLRRELAEEPAAVTAAAAPQSPPPARPAAEGAAGLSGWRALDWMGVAGLGLGAASVLGTVGLLAATYVDYVWVYNQQGKITAFEAQSHYNLMNNAVGLSCLLCAGSVPLLVGGAATLIFSALLDAWRDEPEEATEAR